jgi:hypothetical protein
LPSGVLGPRDLAPLRRLASARAAERVMSMGFSSDDRQCPGDRPVESSLPGYRNKCKEQVRERPGRR